MDNLCHAPECAPAIYEMSSSQTRTVPPHYLVLIFAEGPVSRVERSIPIGAITRLQVSAAQPGPRGPISYAAAPVRADERWLEMLPNRR